MSQAYMPQGSPPPAKTAGSRRWLIAVLTVVVALAVILGGAWLWNMATRPGTVTPTAAETCPGGEKVDTANFSATVPAGWCRESTGALNIHTPKGSVLGLEEEPHPADPSTFCDEAPHAKNPYKVTRLPDGTWGGQPFHRYEIMLTSNDITSYFTCTVVKGSVYILLGTVGAKNDALNLGDTKENFDAGVQSLLASWTWT